MKRSRLPVGDEENGNDNHKNYGQLTGGDDLPGNEDGSILTYEPILRAVGAFPRTRIAGLDASVECCNSSAQFNLE
jgi:hypothetical protein